MDWKAEADRICGDGRKAHYMREETGAVVCLVRSRPPGANNVDVHGRGDTEEAASEAAVMRAREFASLVRGE